MSVDYKIAKYTSLLNGATGRDAAVYRQRLAHYEGMRGGQSGGQRGGDTAGDIEALRSSITAAVAEVVTALDALSNATDETRDNLEGELAEATNNLKAQQAALYRLCSDAAADKAKKQAEKAKALTQKNQELTINIQPLEDCKELGQDPLFEDDFLKEENKKIENAKARLLASTTATGNTSSTSLSPLGLPVPQELPKSGGAYTQTEQFDTFINRLLQ